MQIAMGSIKLTGQEDPSSNVREDAHARLSCIVETDEVYELWGISARLTASNAPQKSYRRNVEIILFLMSEIN